MHAWFNIGVNVFSFLDGGFCVFSFILRRSFGTVVVLFLLSRLCVGRVLSLRIPPLRIRLQTAIHPHNQTGRGTFVLLKCALAGDEVNESKSRDLSTLWRVFAKRPLAGAELLRSENANGKMASVWGSQSLERWASGYTIRKVAALSLARLCASVFYSVTVFSASSFFLFF